MMRDQWDMLPTQLIYGTVMRRITDFLTAGGRGIDFKMGSQASLSDQVGEHALGHCGTADIAVANK